MLKIALKSCSFIILMLVITWAAAAHAGTISTGDVMRDTISDPDRWIIGDTGTGGVTINAGTTQTEDVVWIGNEATGDGTMVVDGATTSLDTHGDLQVGINGSGSLTVSGGATVTTNSVGTGWPLLGNMDIGREAGSQGTVLVRGFST